ncbi:hypothetical protein QR680_007224 [Steinernema hermaphroditum]|uniref:Uncharacterized protein n=1 Tax=Steinernema hermaphroditum TaxID=289476 RepID=A0AA39HZA8_9BILA|nr:hypothetical protein QR680_007224 [Steinernema hermaphroditum]
MPPKRRATASKNEEVSKPKRTKSDEVKNGLVELNEKFGYHHTAALMDFWEFAKQLSTEAPLDAFASLDNLKLVGPFRCLNGEQCENDMDYLLWDRFKSDLPEMQTIMTYKNGRFVFWRDSAEEAPLLVHVDKTESFPKVDVVGSDDPFFAVVHLMGKGESSKFLPGKTRDAYTVELKTIVNKRKKESMGRAFHGPKIKVPMRGDVGYRSVSDSPAKLKKKLETFMTTDDETLKATLRKELLELKSYVDFANDEMDYGMGLEFGHDLFLANNKVFDNLAFRVLETAYTLLKRSKYVDVLKSLRTADGARVGQD